MSVVRLPSGDMWNPENMLSTGTSNVDSLEQHPEPEPALTEEMVGGFKVCPWCGQKPKDMVKHVKDNHSSLFAQDVIEARKTPAEWSKD